MTEDNQVDLERQANQARAEDAMEAMRFVIQRMRQMKNITGLQCRALSESITCAETAYLWLQQVPGNEVAL